MFGSNRNRLERDVRRFHRKFGVPTRNFPTARIPEQERDLRIRLTREESAEVEEALLSGDLAAIAQENIDLIYIAIGNLATYGLTMEGLWDEVHRENMRKVPAPDGGKIRKPEGWVPPRMAPHIIAQCNAGHSTAGPLRWILGVFLVLMLILKFVFTFNLT